MADSRLRTNEMRPKTERFALAATTMLVLTAFAPAAVMAQDGDLSVTTGQATDVTNSSATLNGNLTDLGGEDGATVRFEYWAEGDAENATTVGEETVDSTGSFSADVSGLENNTTYVYVAHAAANNTTVSGDEVTFTPGAQDGEESDSFGAEVSEFVHHLMEKDELDEPTFGHAVATFVLANNPAADTIPEHAGPPEDGERGPPDHAGNAEDSDEERGPPEHAGNDEERGPPGHAGPGGDGSTPTPTPTPTPAPDDG